MPIICLLNLNGPYTTDTVHLENCSLLPGRKIMTNLDTIFKSKDITLPTKVHLVKAMVFPVVVRVEL